MLPNENFQGSYKIAGFTVVPIMIDLFERNVSVFVLYSEPSY